MAFDKLKFQELKPIEPSEGAKEFNDFGVDICKNNISGLQPVINETINKIDNIINEYIEIYKHIYLNYCHDDVTRLDALFCNQSLAYHVLYNTYNKIINNYRIKKDGI